MSAPATPNLPLLSGSQQGTPSLGPQAFPSRGRVGSVSGGPWQLIEVSGKEAAKEVAKSISQQGTPLIGAQRSPPTVPGGPPADLEEWSIDDQPAETQEPPAGQPRPQYGSIPQYGSTPTFERWGELEPDEDDPDGFDAKLLIGDWTDNLGHRVLVTPTEINGRQRDRRRKNKGGGKGGGRIGFLACLQKFGMPEKRFNLNKDRVKKQWTCGNGVLVPEESGNEKIVWKAPDGRMSTWDRLPPEGPVYFDMPPAPVMNEEEGQHPPWLQAGGMQMHPGGTVYYPGPEQTGAPPQGEWKGLNLPGDGDALHQAGAPLLEKDCGDAAAASGAQWNLSAAEFVPSAQPAAAPGSTPGTPGMQPHAAPGTPGMQPQVPPGGPQGVQALACMLKLSEESPDVKVTANRLEWTLPDNWGKLHRFPKDFCLTSPMFGVRQAANMQLVFYPNGSRTAEAGRCTVALTRGPDSAGIKFEFSVNGRGSGPKVCLGRRYLGDYPQPFDDAEDKKEKDVVVSMQVLEVLGI